MVTKALSRLARIGIQFQRKGLRNDLAQVDLALQDRIRVGLFVCRRCTRRQEVSKNLGAHLYAGTSRG